MINKELIERIQYYKTISKDDLFDLIQDNYKVKKSKTYEIVNELINAGYIHRVTSNIYSLEKKKEYRYDLTNYAIKLNSVLKKYGIPYIIYETNILNEWLNHLLNNNYIIVEVENDYLSFIFDYLKENGFKNILLNPDINELDKYKEDNSIILISYPKYAPIKDEYILIEKLIVDLFSNKIIKSIYEENELNEIYKQIFETYKIDFKKVFSYAKRKKKYDKFYDYLIINNLMNNSFLNNRKNLI